MAASGDRPNKRTRNDPSSDPSAGSKKTITPFEASKCTLVEKLATLPTLHESQKTYLLDTHVRFTKLRKNLKNLQNRRKETDVDTYQLKSARFAFTLTSSDHLYSDKKKEVDELRENCVLAITHMQSKIRKEVVKLIDLEIESIKNRIQKVFAEAIFLTANSLAILDPSLTQANSHDIYRFCFDNAQNAPLLLKYSCFADANGLYDLAFEAEQQVASTRAPATPAAGVPAPTAYRCPDEPTYAVTATDSVVPTFFAVAESLFTLSWNSYLKAEQDILHDQQVSKYIKTVMAASASDVTAMDVDDIQTPDNNTLEQTVKRAMAAESKKIRAALEKTLGNQLAKNVPRGALKPGASPKKKKVSFRQPLEQPGKRRGKQAADSDNDSSKGNRRKNKARNSSTKNKQRSKNRGRR